MLSVRLMSALGHKRTFCECGTDVRYTPESGHLYRTSRCPLSATSRPEQKGPAQPGLTHLSSDRSSGDQRLERRMLLYEAEIFRPGIEAEHMAGTRYDQRH